MDSLHDGHIQCPISVGDVKVNFDFKRCISPTISTESSSCAT